MPTQILYEPNAPTEVLFDIVLPSKMQWHDLTFVRYPSVSLLSRQSLSPSVFALIGSSRHDTNFLYLPSPSIIHFDLRGFLPWEKGERGAQWNTHTACQSHQFLESLRKGDVGKRKKGRKEVFVFTTALKSPGQISKEFSLLSQKVFKYIFSMFLVELTVHLCHRWSCESYSQLLKAWIAILFSLHSSVWHCELFSSGGVFFFSFAQTDQWSLAAVEICHVDQRLQVFLSVIWLTLYYTLFITLFSGPGAGTSLLWNLRYESDLPGCYPNLTNIPDRCVKQQGTKGSGAL